MANEVIAPTTGTFAAGNDIIGMGTTLPTELSSWAPYGAGHGSIKSAIIFYNSSWSTSLTTGQVKYFFLAFGYNTSNQQCDLFTGACYVADAHVSTTGVILPINAFGVTAGEVNYQNVFNHDLVTMFEVAEDDGSGDGIVRVQNAAGTTTVGLVSNLGREGASTGGVQTLDASSNVISQI